MTILKCQKCGYACYGPCHFCGHPNAPAQTMERYEIPDEQIIDDEPDPIKPSLINKFLSWLKN